MNSSTADIYRRAADRLARPHGWTQDAYTDDDGGECPVQAVLSAAGLSGESLPRRMAKEMEAYLRNHVPSYSTNRYFSRQKRIEVWNDTAGRRKREVINFLRGLADSLDPPAVITARLTTKPLTVRTPSQSDIAAKQPARV